MEHLLLTDDPFFLNYSAFGFNVRVLEESEDPMQVIDETGASMVLITEGLWDVIEPELDPRSPVAVIPIPDRKNKGKIAKDSIERMLSRIVGRL
ncbi:hypothetical protein KAJ26_04530 [bacterium]|nr:hypothetical protein [bacterium]